MRISMIRLDLEREPSWLDRGHGVRLHGRHCTTAPVMAARAAVARGVNARPDERATWRNGYRDRALDIRLGQLNLRIPKLRTGSWFPLFLEACKTAEKALISVIEEAWIAGVSTRKVDDLVQAPPGPPRPGLPDLGAVGDG